MSNYFFRSTTLFTTLPTIIYLLSGFPPRHQITIEICQCCTVLRYQVGTYYKKPHSQQLLLILYRCTFILYFGVSVGIYLPEELRDATVRIVCMSSARWPLSHAGRESTECQTLRRQMMVYEMSEIKQNIIERSALRSET